MWNRMKHRCVLVALAALSIMAHAGGAEQTANPEYYKGPRYGQHRIVYPSHEAPPTCPTWAACSDAARPPYQAADCSATPGFGLVPQPKHYPSSYDDEDDKNEYASASRTWGTCFPCKDGYYAPPSGTSPCLPCGNMTAGHGWTTPFGATCTKDCWCQPGYGGPDCTLCPIGSWSPGGTFDNPRPRCEECTKGSTTADAGSNSRTDCSVCSPGYAFPDSSSPTECCGECRICPANTFSDGSGCVPCPDHTTSVPGTESLEYCACTEPGYGLTILDFNGITTSCQKCADGSFSYKDLAAPAGTSNLCVPCSLALNVDSVPYNAYTTFGPGASSISQCACAAGFGFNVLAYACEPCQAPSYQGVLSPSGVPVTTATPENPWPQCTFCPGAIGDTPTSNVGDANGMCLFNSFFPGPFPGAYCAPLSATQPTCANCSGLNLELPGDPCINDNECCTGVCGGWFNNFCCLPQGMQCNSNEQCCSGECQENFLTGDGIFVCSARPPCFSGATRVRILESDTPVAIRDLKTGQHVQCLNTNEDLRLPTDIGFCEVMNWFHAEETQLQQIRIGFTRPTGGAAGFITVSSDHLVLKLTDAAVGSTASNMEQFGAFATVGAATVVPGDKMAVLTDQGNPSAGFTVVAVTTVQQVAASGMYLPVLKTSPYIIAEGVVAPLFTTGRTPMVVPPATSGTKPAFSHYQYAPLFMQRLQPIGTSGRDGQWDGKAMWPGQALISAAKKPHIAAGQAVDFVTLRDWFMPLFAAWKANPAAVITVDDVVAMYTPDTVWVPNPNARRSAMPRDDEEEEIVADAAGMEMLRTLKKALASLRGSTKPAAARRANKRELPIGNARVFSSAAGQRGGKAAAPKTQP